MHPLAKNHFSKCPKVLKKNVGMHLHILCLLTKFYRKKIFFGAYVKKTILWYKITIYVTFFYLFIQATTNIFSHQNFRDGHSMFRCILRIFCPNFLIFLNAFKMYFHNKSICSYEPKHHNILYFKTERVDNLMNSHNSLI
jgi:hypothetical protein